MATKKKSTRKQAKSKKTTAGKKPSKKKVARKKTAHNKKRPVAKVAQKPAAKRQAAKKNATKKTAAEARLAAKSRDLERNRSSLRAFSGESRGSGSAGQSGDLQGLSRVERADSESVEELIEEGNAFEADVVSGVEDADNADEREVHTHEVAEDDVPEEYLDKD
jgi:hypothetical protein